MRMLDSMDVYNMVFSHPNARPLARPLARLLGKIVRQDFLRKNKLRTRQKKARMRCGNELMVSDGFLVFFVFGMQESMHVQRGCQDGRSYHG